MARDTELSSMYEYCVNGFDPHWTVTVYKCLLVCRENQSRDSLYHMTHSTHSA